MEQGAESGGLLVGREGRAEGSSNGIRRGDDGVNMKAVFLSPIHSKPHLIRLYFPQLVLREGPSLSTR